MIIIKEELLITILEEFKGWWESPEKFLSFILLADELTELDISIFETPYSARLEFAGELAALLIREMGVDISPYRDFNDLRNSCLFDGDYKEMLRHLSDRMKEDDNVFSLAEEMGIMPSQETMVTEMTHGFLARAVVERLRPFVDFR